MKVVYLAEWYPQLSAKVTHSIATRLVRRGCEVVVLASTVQFGKRLQPFGRTELIDGVRVERVSGLTLNTSATPYVVYNPLDVMIRTPALLQEIRSADIVHAQTVHGLLNGFGFASLRSTRETSKLVVSSHGVPRYNSPATWMGFQWWMSVMREMGRNSRMVTTVAKSSMPMLKSLGIDEAKIRYIPNGVDCSVFRRAPEIREETRQRLGFRENEIVVMSLGDLRAAKGVFVFLDAIPRILSSSQNACILIAGSGPLLPQVRHWLAQNHESTSDRVRTIFRHITEPELPRLFNCCDIFVLASYWEGVPLALLEAMACGVPVVASSVGDIPHIIQHSRNGLTFHSGNSADLAGRVIELVKSLELRESISRQSVESMRSHDWNDISEKYYKLYSELVGQDQRSGERQ